MRKYIWWILGGVVVIILIVWVRNKATAKPTSSNGSTSSNSTVANLPEPSVLKIGAKGERVKGWQRYINDFKSRIGVVDIDIADQPNLVVDGNFGAKTEKLTELLKGKKSVTWEEIKVDVSPFMYK